MKRYFTFFTFTLVSSLSFAQKQMTDLLIYNAKIYTVDAQFSTASAMTIKEGKIIATGNYKNLSARYTATEKVNAQGAIIFPGFIDAHAHFLGYGLGLQEVALTGTSSWDEILKRVQQFATTKKIKKGDWIKGRGWDQNDWTVKEFPSREKLDQLFPDNPVLLTRVDGHAAIVNGTALTIAGVQQNTTVNGGQLEVKEGKLTGILIDNAIALVDNKIPLPSTAQLTNALMEAQENCFAVGLTTVEDCGIDYPSVILINELQKKEQLHMRIYAMLSDDPLNFAWAKNNGKLKTPYLQVASFKVYADGALGSRGACLLQPYTDKPAWTGFLRSSLEHFDSVAKEIYAMGWQMNTHAIGDSGNRAILNIYAKYLGGKNDRRWRIEHAQVINENDFSLFGKMAIIPSVQPTHATSDMYWAEKRVGAKRLKGAYAYKKLLQQNGWMPLGTDFPVEDISPFKTFYAAVFRIDAKQFPAGGFQISNALSRKEAIMGMTIWAAKSNFEEREKGSLEKGKWADFIMLDKDLMTTKAADIVSTKVLATYIGGKKVYSAK